MSDREFWKRVVVINGAVPLAMLAWDASLGELGANPVNSALHTTGLMSLLFLMFTLTVTPLRRLTGWNSVIVIRRSLGLLSFFYACLHLAIYVTLDRELNLTSAIDEMFTRRFLQVGLVALLLMVPLAITSTDAMISWLGAVRWKRLHRLVYVVAGLGVLHYYMQVKSDVRQPLAFAGVLAILLASRLPWHYLASRNAAMPSAATPAQSQPETTEESQPETGFKPTAVTFARSGKTASLTPDMSILEAGESVGLDLPYECRSGYCGQCKMRLIAGSVAMEIEDALSAAEKNAGWILGCQAIALGDVTVDA